MQPLLQLSRRNQIAPQYNWNNTLLLIYSNNNKVSMDTQAEPLLKSSLNHDQEPLNFLS